MPESGRSRVLVVTPGNTYLEAALLLDEYLDVTLLAPEKYPPAQGFDVTIFDGVAPPVAKHTGSALYLAPPAQGSPVPLGKRIEMFGFDTWDKKSPIVRWTALGDIQVAHGNTFKPEQGDRVVGASDLGPILVAGRRAGRKFVALGFDPRNSDFVLRVAWPLFVLNTINDFVEEDTGYVSSYRTGDVWQIPVHAPGDLGWVTEPGGARHRVAIKEGRAAYAGMHAGF